MVRAALLGAILAVAACGPDAWVPVSGTDGAVKSAATVRAARRAYDGAPPVVGHEDFGMACGACHDERGQSVEGVGFAPASPHEGTDQDPSTARCRQCHVFQVDEGVFVENGFVGLTQDLRRGERLYPTAPPTVPHRTLMRENCVACHSGPAAREEIRTSHPERVRCRQCHVPVTTRNAFASALTARGLEPADSEGR